MPKKTDGEILLEQLKVGAVTGKGVLDRLFKMKSDVRSIDNLSMQALIGEIIKFYYEKYNFFSIYYKGFVDLKIVLSKSLKILLSKSLKILRIACRK